MRSRSLRAVLLFSASLTLLSVLAAPAGAGAGDWPAYLNGPKHWSFNAGQLAITPANAASLSQTLHWVPPLPSQPGAPDPWLLASPSILNGIMYVGANSGDFFAVDYVTGAIQWQRYLGYTPALSCPSRGITSSPTLAPDPTTGRVTVYVGGGDGYLYALNAADGGVLWSTKVVDIVDPTNTLNPGYIWGSPTLVGGKIFLGMSSNCDVPLIRGGVTSYDQATGTPLASYYTVPDGVVGGSVWSSVAATSNGSAINLYVTTGNGDFGGGDPGDSFSIVRVDGTTMTKQDIWTAPGELGTDHDFGASPILFSAMLGSTPTPMVGACNKDGTFFALRRDDLAAGPVWHRKIGPFCISAGAWDATNGRLYLSAGTTTIGGTRYLGSIRQVDPATGDYIWERPLSGSVLGSPTLDGVGVIAVPVYKNTRMGVVLVDTTDGTILSEMDINGRSYAQPVFADGRIFDSVVCCHIDVYAP